MGHFIGLQTVFIEVKFLSSCGSFHWPVNSNHRSEGLVQVLDHVIVLSTLIIVNKLEIDLFEIAFPLYIFGGSVLQ